MTELQAAVGLEQLKKLEQFVDARVASADRLTELLAGVDVQPVLPLEGTVGVYFSIRSALTRRSCRYP